MKLNTSSLFKLLVGVGAVPVVQRNVVPTPAIWNAFGMYPVAAWFTTTVIDMEYKLSVGTFVKLTVKFAVGLVLTQ